jgi:hypothetical protein
MMPPALPTALPAYIRYRRFFTSCQCNLTTDILCLAASCVWPQVLRLARCELHDAGGAVILFALCNHPCLRELDLSWNALSHGTAKAVEAAFRCVHAAIAPQDQHRACIHSSSRAYCACINVVPVSAIVSANLLQAVTWLHHDVETLAGILPPAGARLAAYRLSACHTAA